MTERRPRVATITVHDGGDWWSLVMSGFNADHLAQLKAVTAMMWDPVSRSWWIVDEDELRHARRHLRRLGFTVITREGDSAPPPAPRRRRLVAVQDWRDWD